MAEVSILDARQPDVFLMEVGATRLIPAVGARAWAVYTLLVRHAAQCRGAIARVEPEAIAIQSGLTITEVHRAVELLILHGLIEPGEPAAPGLQDGAPAYRILSAGPSAEQGERWDRERESRMAGRRLFEALIDVCGFQESSLDPKDHRQIIAAVETIRSAGGNAAQVYDAALVYREKMAGLPLTPRNLAMCWPMLVEMLPTDEVVSTP